MSFFQELKRRNVFRVGVAYLLAAWVLLQAADFVLQVIAAPGWILQVFVLAAAIGLPVVLVFSWVFEMTPEGIKRESQIDRSKSITPNTGHKLDRVIIVFLAVAVVILLADRFIVGGRSAAESSADSRASAFMPSGAPADTEKSIAVLPFVNMSSDPEQEFFSDGIAEEILNVLTRIPNLKVAARTSSFKFKGQQMDAAEIGRQLQVNHLLEGSVRKSGTTLRITAQLIETDTGFHLWSKTFDRQMEDVFAVQDEIAAAIGAELQASLSGAASAPSATADIAAYELYLKGRGLVAQRRESSMLQGIALLESAHIIDPTYAPVMAMLATANAVLPWFSIQLPTGEARELARHWATKALAVEPDNAEALAVLALVKYDIDRDWAGAQHLFEQALKVNPGNLTANNFYGDFLLRTGDFDRALVYETKAAELDPLSAVMLTDLASVYTLRGEFDQVVALGKRALALDPQQGNAMASLWDGYYFLGDVAGLEEVLSTARAIPGLDERLIETFRLQLLLVTEGRERVLAELGSQWKWLEVGKETASGLAQTMSMFGEFDSAGELLQQAYAENDSLWLYPLNIRLPEQAPDSAPWQEFWRQPGMAELAEIRRGHGMSPDVPAFGSRAKP